MTRRDAAGSWVRGDRWRPGISPTPRPPGASRPGRPSRNCRRAERHAALRQAFQDLPPPDQRLILLLLQDPPVPHAEISARLGIPAGSIGAARRRCLDKLCRHPAIAALIMAHMTAADEMHGPVARR